MKYKRFLALVGSILLSIQLTTAVSAADPSEKFGDVQSSHWAYGTIQWAINNGVIKGYPDGTFKPSKQVSEAEFLMMFISAYEEVKPISGQTHWADPVYEIAVSKNWPVNGAAKTAIGRATRDQAVTRGDVANIIAGANGINYIGKDAIQYLLNENLAGGKTGSTVEGYKGNDKLTRAEAVAFIKRAMDNGLTKLEDRPRFPTDKPVTPPATNVPTGVKTVYDAIVKTISASAYKGYEVKSNAKEVSVNNSDGYASVSYMLPQSGKGSNQVITFDASSSASQKLATDMLKAAGVPVTSSFTSKLSSAVESRETSTTTYGGYKVSIEPHPTAYDTVVIRFSK
ncbi:S-layer homology domain-containing protein [Paenibacillus barcinonensis]|uniref:S-layer family protein n=1 Tax=Paenibacillus barcinonensis TaxID=198119 RepID=A0A2V4VKJ5_PAEBA|nr:S-layer homology domain-containing protein [Paenibacillus barcinonensis]PYE49764.1 S-layer family protein [Paenibacillus barcinonensis]QKS56546.1 S-layer homology domain-containing protein [Paenibacillus barcinonensis]